MNDSSPWADEIKLDKKPKKVYPTITEWADRREYYRLYLLGRLSLPEKKWLFESTDFLLGVGTLE